MNRLNKEIARALSSPSIKDVWTKQGADTVTMTPERLQNDIQKLGKMVRAAGAKVD